MSRRVVITGIGPVTPAGIGKDTFWQSLLAGPGPARASGGDVGDCGMTHHSRPCPSYVLLGAVRSPAGLIAYEFDLHGPCRGISAACATGNICLQDASREITLGNTDVMIVGSTDAPLVAPRPFADFDALGAMSRRNDDPRAAFRPFDRERDGFVISEGAGVVVLEELEHAKTRGASTYAEVLSVSDYTFPDSTFARARREGYSGSLNAALRRAELTMTSLRGACVYVNAHGTATVNNDVEETAAFRDVFGVMAEDLLISSTKPVTGHQQTACSTNELIVCALALSKGVAPPTFNLDAPDAECCLNYLSGKAVQRRIDYAISNTSGFCGIYSAAVLRRA